MSRIDPQHQRCPEVKTGHELGNGHTSQQAKESTMEEYFVCPVCSKRWGTAKVDGEVIIQRCEKHKNQLSTAEIYAKGMTVGHYNRLREAD
jgi:hypothetical protein